MKRKFYLLYSLALALVLSGCGSLPYPRTYSSEALEGRIVDENSGEPVEGVNVAAYWELYALGFEAAPNGVIKIMETVTDADGRYHFPAWGPVPVLRTGTLYHGIQFVVFKSGYVVSGAREGSRGGLPGLFQLRKFIGTTKEYASYLGHLDSDLGFIKEDCLWQRIPRMLLATTEEFRKLNNILGDRIGSIANIDSYFSHEIHERRITRQCGISPREFFKSYQP